MKSGTYFLIIVTISNLSELRLLNTFSKSDSTSSKDIFISVKRGIAKRILSEKKERWWTVNMCFSEIDTLRDQYDNENDAETLKTLESINSYVMSVQQKYENA